MTVHDGAQFKQMYVSGRPNFITMLKSFLIMSQPKQFLNYY
jgi:hypothetical protein